jgi:hypothetical protein
MPRQADIEQIGATLVQESGKLVKLVGTIGKAVQQDKDPLSAPLMAQEVRTTERIDLPVIGGLQSG